MTDVGALPDTWVTDTALLERILTRLREWNPEPQRRTPGAPQFGVSCRRASAAGPLIDITMPVACPPAMFRRPVGPTERRP